MGLSSLRSGKKVFGAVTQTIVMNCETTLSVGQLVRQDQTTPDKVIAAIDNQIKFPIIGVVSAKPTTTTCEVILRGVIDVPVLPVGRAYLSSTGYFTTDTAIPKPFYLQVLGYSFGNGKLHFEPNSIVTLNS